jgi:SAM-dependent methyltransferase
MVSEVASGQTNESVFSENLITSFRGDLDETASQKVQSFFRHAPVRESWPWRHWVGHPRVRHLIQRRLTGFSTKTLLESLVELFQQLGLSLPVERAASLGCGAGRLDRGLYRHNIVSGLWGFDLSPDSLVRAQRWARSAGIESFHYQEADLNQLDLEPASFDLIVAEMSLHHTNELERLFQVIAKALRAGGLLFMDEYVGPTRFRWSEPQMKAVNVLLDSFPDKYRTTPDGVYKSLIEHMPMSFFEAVDPSESIRSGEVMSCLQDQFDVLWQRPYGGTILHPLLHDIACNFPEGDPEAESLLDTAIAMEESMLKSGALSSDFTALIAAPRR